MMEIMVFVTKPTSPEPELYNRYIEQIINTFSSNDSCNITFI